LSLRDAGGGTLVNAAWLERRTLNVEAVLHRGEAGAMADQPDEWIAVAQLEAGSRFLDRLGA